MAKIDDLLASYGAYHTHPFNIKIHFIGVPLVTLGLFQFLGWFSFVLYPTINLGTVFFVGIAIYYLRLNIKLASLAIVGFFPIFLAAQFFAQLPKTASVISFFCIFILGWFFQLWGHKVEGKRPALADNIWQVFNAPIFLAYEVLQVFKSSDPQKT